MFIALAVVLAVAWIIAFIVLHVTSVAVHTLIILAAASALMHVIKPRKYHAPADAPVPKDAVK